MKIDLKKPRYVLPLILLPFICILFYVYKSNFGNTSSEVTGRDSLQANIAPVSDQVQKQSLSDKLEAYRNAYKHADGYTAIGTLLDEQDSLLKPATLYNDRERKMLDSIEKAIKGRYSARISKDLQEGLPPDRSLNYNLVQDREIAEALKNIQLNQKSKAPSQINAENPDPDPMELFRKQMEVIDSMGKANDPDYQEKQNKIELAARQVAKKNSRQSLPSANPWQEIRFSIRLPVTGTNLLLPQ